MIPPTRTEDIVSRIRISEVWRALGGGELHRSRGRAFWREGDGFNVSLNDSKNVWHDFASGEGGGLLDLVLQVNGGTRSEALRWLADFAGTPLERGFGAHERAEYARERAGFERDLKTARQWRRTAVLMCEETLAVLKAALFNPSAGPLDVEGISAVEQLLSQLRETGDAALVSEYRRWRDRQPVIAAAMLWAAEKRECAERRALDHFIASMEAMGG